MNTNNNPNLDTNTATASTGDTAADKDGVLLDRKSMMAHTRGIFARKCPRCGYHWVDRLGWIADTTYMGAKRSGKIVIGIRYHNDYLTPDGPCCRGEMLDIGWESGGAGQQ